MTRRFDRRTFLAGLASSVVVVSCSSEDSGSGSDDGAPSDRSARSSTTRPTSTTTVSTPTAGLTTNPFGLGVASGDPTPTSVILWTRLLVEGADDVPLKWEVAKDEAFTEPVASGIVEATVDHGHSVHLDATDLDSDGTWWYRFSVDDFVSPVGRARTMPADDESPEQLRIGFASCQNFPVGYYSAHRAMAADRLDLVFFLGDYIYEGPSAPDQLRQVPGGECQTLDDYRLRYATYTADADLQASRAACPWVVTWDDHEVENNYADLDNTGGLDIEAFTQRRFAGYQAFYEHMPVRLDPPTSGNWQLYRTVRFGDLAEFYVLDGRQYRSPQPCDDADDAIVDTSGCTEIENLDATMLGDIQEDWLIDGLRGSSTGWRVLAQQTVMSSLVLGDIVLNVDQWDGYPAARQRLLGTVLRDEIENVIVLTGDIHSAGAAVLNTIDVDGQPAPAAVEFVGTSITSASLADRVPGGADILTPDKFGLAYLNVRDHGYGRCTVTKDEWRTEFVVVESILDAAAPARVDATCVVASGAPSVKVL